MSDFCPVTQEPQQYHSRAKERIHVQHWSRRGLQQIKNSCNEEENL